MSISRSLLALSFAVGLAGPAFAQAGSTQTPPAPNSAASSPQTSNDLPAGAMTTNPNSPGGSTPTLGAQTGMTGMGTPAAPSGSTGNNPSAAFDRTVPQPSTAR